MKGWLMVPSTLLSVLVCSTCFLRTIFGFDKIWASVREREGGGEENRRDLHGIQFSISFLSHKFDFSKGTFSDHSNEFKIINPDLRAEEVVSMEGAGGKGRGDDFRLLLCCSNLFIKSMESRDLPISEHRSIFRKTSRAVVNSERGIIGTSTQEIIICLVRERIFGTLIDGGLVCDVVKPLLKIILRGGRVKGEDETEPTFRLEMNSGVNELKTVLGGITGT
jgi:hypothetical protein